MWYVAPKAYHTLKNFDMIIFNYLRKKSPKIKQFYEDYDKHSIFGKILWWIMFINWIPMAFALTLLLVSAILWNFVDCGGFFYTSLIITAIVFIPWIVSGFVNSLKDYKNA